MFLGRQVLRPSLQWKHDRLKLPIVLYMYDALLFVISELFFPKTYLCIFSSIDIFLLVSSFQM